MAVTDQKKHQAESKDSVVVSSAPHHARIKWTVVLPILLVAVLLVVGVVLWHNSYSRPEVQLKKGSAISSQVDNLDKDQIDGLASGKADAQTNADKAYAKALALSRLNKNDQSLQEFKQLIAAGDTKYYVYVDYALVQGRAGDLTSAVKTMQLAIEKLNNDTSVSQVVKDSQLKYLNSLLLNIQDEAAHQ